MNSFNEVAVTAEKYLAGNPSDSLYLLIDHAGMSGLQRKIENSSVAWVSLFDKTRESSALVAAPILILIGERSSLQMSRTLLYWICERVSEGSSLIMLASSLPINKLQHELTLRLDIKISENMDAMLRFFDARILEKLIEILNAEQTKVLCGPARKWWYANRMGEVVEIKNEFIYTGNFCQINLTQEQEFALINASEPDQVLHILLKTMPQLAALMPKNQYCFIADNIRSASRLGLCSVSDFVLYSTMVTLCGADFEALPYWENTLVDVRAERISFAAAVANCEDVALEVE
jgi:hypothetical protein